MMTQRGALNLHPMLIDGPVTSFAPFHNVNCPHGFLHFNAEVKQGCCHTIELLTHTTEVTQGVNFKMVVDAS